MEDDLIIFLNERQLQFFNQAFLTTSVVSNGGQPKKRLKQWLWHRSG
jgi:hypothetical protein